LTQNFDGVFLGLESEKKSKMKPKSDGAANLTGQNVSEFSFRAVKFPFLRKSGGYPRKIALIALK